MKHVAVTLNEDTFEIVCLSWEKDGDLYHVWTHDPTTLYKNPPLGVKYGDEGHFQTRKLNATAHVNAQMIGLARVYAREQGTVEKAKAEMIAAKATEDEKNRLAYAQHCKREAAEELYEALKAIMRDGRIRDHEPLGVAARKALRLAEPPEAGNRQEEK